MSLLKLNRIAFATLIALGGLVAEASAQNMVVPGPNGPMVVPANPGMAPAMHPHHPSHPAYLTPEQISGYNPQTGGFDTSSMQINNSAFDHGRNESMNNGTKRWVRRPIYDPFGNVCGYQEGWQWYNSYTNQMHGSFMNYTPNQMGGVNEQQMECRQK